MTIGKPTIQMTSVASSAALLRGNAVAGGSPIAALASADKAGVIRIANTTKCVTSAIFGNLGNTMTPLQIEILLHYHCRADDYRNGDHKAAAVQEALHWFLSEDMLRHDGFTPEHLENGMLKSRYSLTPRGKAFVEYLQMIPLPTASWTFGQVSWRGQEAS